MELGEIATEAVWIIYGQMARPLEASQMILEITNFKT